MNKDISKLIKLMVQSLAMQGQYAENANVHATNSIAFDLYKVAQQAYQMADAMLQREGDHMTQLSWQPPAVTKCEDCPYASVRYGTPSCEAAADMYKVRKQNKNGITKTCPMWIEQNKETPNANT